VESAHPVAVAIQLAVEAQPRQQEVSAQPRQPEAVTGLPRQQEAVTGLPVAGD